MLNADPGTSQPASLFLLLNVFSSVVEGRDLF